MSKSYSIYVTEEQAENFENEFKLYFINAYLVSINSPLLMMESNENDGSCIANFFSLLFLIEKTNALEKIDDQIEEKMH